MKKILFILATLICSAQLSLAQKRDTIPDSKYLTVDEQREILMQTRNEIRLGSSFVGIGAFSRMFLLGNPDFTEIWTIPPISLDYSYRVVEFLEVGGFMSYDLGGYTYNKESTKKNISHFISVVAYARYSWLNRRYVQLYSTLGFGINFDCEVGTNTNTGVTTSRCNVTPIPEVVPFGVRFGGRLFGYCEPIGISVRGIFLNLGIGYKF